MAPREVKAEDCPSEFTKLGEIFQKVGDKFVGLYEKHETGQYGQDYTWQLKDGSTMTFTAKGLLEKMLGKAKLAQGEKATITLTAEIPTKHENPKRVFGLKVDDAPKGFKSALQDEPAPESSETGDDSDW